MTRSPIAVIGAGSWGTALAVLLARNGSPVTLWDNDPRLLAQLQQQRENQRYLPGVKLPDAITVVEQFDDAFADLQDILLAVPSHAFGKVVSQIHELSLPKYRLAWATKGLEPQTARCLHLVAQSIVGDSIPLAAISGPTFAMEVGQGLPSAMAIAATDQTFMSDMTQRLQNPTFRMHSCDDLIGLQVCGAVKNVLAIATGLCVGLGFGANSRAALITYGLAEMQRLGVALNAKAETFLSVAGLGDLVLTAGDDQSRNRRFGIALGEGQSAEDAKQAIDKVVEGADTITLVWSLAQKHKVDMPLTQAVYEIVIEQADPKTKLLALFSPSEHG